MRRHKSFEAFLASALVDTGFIRIARLKKALDKCESDKAKQDAIYQSWRKTYPKSLKRKK